MSAVFIGHGNPMNAIERNAWADAWQGIAERLPRPRAVLVIPPAGTCPTAGARRRRGPNHSRLRWLLAPRAIELDHG